MAEGLQRRFSCHNLSISFLTKGEDGKINVVRGRHFPLWLPLDEIQEHCSYFEDIKMCLCESASVPVSRKNVLIKES